MPAQWFGEEIAAKVRNASIEAIDEITTECAIAAEQDHWWTSHADRLQRETISEPAAGTVLGVSGKFGTTEHRGFYGLFLEYKQPWLRPVADRLFPTLSQRIEEKLR